MIGLLKRRVVLSAPARVDDAGGGAAVSYSPASSVWAEIRSPGAEESVVGGAPRALVRHRLLIRFRDDVAPGWRAAWGAHDARVASVRDEEGTRRWLVLDCEEEVG